MALNIFQTYKYHEFVDKKLSLYKVSEDGINYGIANSPFINGAIEIVPMKYEYLQFFRIDRILAKYKGKFGFISADPISSLYHERTDLWSYNEYEIVIPFFFDSVSEIEKGLFNVSVDSTSFVMDIEGRIQCSDIGLFKRVFDPLYHNKGFDQITGIYLAECMRYTVIDKGLISLLYITSETSDGSFIIGRGWHHFSNEDGDYDWDDFTCFGMLDRKGNSIIPSLFEEIEERTDIWDGYYIAKFRRYYSGTKQKLNGELDYAEGNGDLYLFTKEGECVLAGFSKIVMEDEDTLRVYFKDYQANELYTKNHKIFEYYRIDPSYNAFMVYDEFDSSYYVRLNREFKLKEIPNSYASFRNSYLEMFHSNDVPFKVPEEVLRRLKLHILPVSLVFSHYDEEKEQGMEFDYDDYECNPPIDDPLDAFDGDADAYNEWRL